MEDKIENKGEISDGYHTFNELYEHRHLLFLNLLQFLEDSDANIYWVADHYEGWDLVVVELYQLKDKDKSKPPQISYHIPIRLRPHYVRFMQRSNEEYEYDGHTSADVLARLERLIAK